MNIRLMNNFRVVQRRTNHYHEAWVESVDIWHMSRVHYMV